MKWYLNLTVLIFLITSSNLNAQSTFLKKFPMSPSSTSLDNKSNTSILVDNQNNIVFSVIKSYLHDSLNYNTFSSFFKTNETGNLLFYKTFRNPDEVKPMDIIKTNDGGYLLTGFANNIDSAAMVLNFILKTDSLGNVLWSKSSVDSNGTSGIKLAMLNDSIYFGTSSYFNAATGSDIYYYAVNNDGNVWFEKTLRSSGNESGRSLLTLSGNVYLLANTVNSFDSINEFLIVKIDALGNTVWKKRYHYNNINGYQQALFMSKKNDHTLAVAGNIFSNSSDFFLFEVDTNGTVINSKVYDIQYYDDITSLQSDGNSGYLINCLTQPQSGIGNFTILSLDSNLNVTHSKNVLGSHYGFGTQGPTFLKSNNSYYLGGIQYNNNPISSVPFIMKLDSNYNTACTSVDVVISITSVAMTANNIGFFQFEDSVNLLQTKAIFSQDIAVNDTTYCQFVVSITEPTQNNTIYFYPNPVSNGSVEFMLAEETQPILVEIIDLAGNLILKTTIEQNKNKLNINTLTSGLYFVKYMDTKKSLLKTEKLVILK